MSDTYARSRTWLTFLGFALIAGFFLLTEHRAHFFGALPFLFLLLCPLLHVFGHGGHGSHARDGQRGAEESRPQAPSHGAGATRDDWRS